MPSRVTGFNEMVARLNSYSNEVQEDVKFIVYDNLRKIEVQASLDAPDGGDRIDVQGGSIRQDQISDRRRGNNVPINQAIGVEMESSGYKGSVYVERSAGDIAAYVEFGTGQSAATYLATVPAEWRAEARKFFVNGQGRILAKPFMLPAFNKYSLAFKKELKALFKANRL